MPRCPSQLATIIADWPNCKKNKVSVVVKSYIFHTIQPSFRYAKWNQDSLYLKLLPFILSYKIVRVHVQWQLTNHFLSHCRCASQLQLGVHVHVCIMNNTPKKNQDTFMRSWKYLFFLQMERTLDVRNCTSFWWFTSTPSSISLLTSSSSPALAAIMRSLQSSIWNAAVCEIQLHKTWHCHNDLFSAFHICNHQML